MTTNVQVLRRPTEWNARRVAQQLLERARQFFAPIESTEASASDIAELMALAESYEKLQPSYAADLRAAAQHYELNKIRQAQSF